MCVCVCSSAVPFHRYTRNLVERGNGRYNLIVLCWDSGQGSSIHDHAGSHCFMKVLNTSTKECSPKQGCLFLIKKVPSDSVSVYNFFPASVNVNQLIVDYSETSGPAILALEVKHYYVGSLSIENSLLRRGSYCIESAKSG